MGAGAGTCAREGALGGCCGGRGGRGPRAPELEELTWGGRGDGPGDVACRSATCPAGAAGPVDGPPEGAAECGGWVTVDGWMSAIVSLIQCGATSCSRVTSLEAVNGSAQHGGNPSHQVLQPRRFLQACCRTWTCILRQVNPPRYATMRTTF